MSDGDVERWLGVAQPIAPQTCVACGGVSLRGFVYCGWCGAPLRDETRMAAAPPHDEAPTVPMDPRPPQVRPAGLGYAAEPVDFPASEKITLVHWPADGQPTQEITQPSNPIRLGLEAPPQPDDTHPRARSQTDKAGVCVVVLGSGPNGLHQPPTDVQLLTVGDELDVITHESGSTTSFRVEPDGLRVIDVGAARSVARHVFGPSPLQSGDEFRLGQTWLTYARHEGREAWGIWGRVYVLAPSGHVITHYDVGEVGLVLGSGFGDPTLSFDGHVARRHCRVHAGPTGATIEPLEGASTCIAVTDGELLPTGSIACFADTAVRLDPMQ